MFFFDFDGMFVEFVLIFDSIYVLLLLLMLFDELLCCLYGVVVIVFGCGIDNFDIFLKMFDLLIVGLYGVECCDVNGDM